MKLFERERPIDIIVVALLLIAVEITAVAGYFGLTGLSERQTDIRICSQEAKQCPDGSYVGRTSPNCEFAECQTFNVRHVRQEVDTSDWKTYRNEEYGFEVKYPSEWSPVAVDSTNIIFDDVVEPVSIRITSPQDAFHLTCILGEDTRCETIKTKNDNVIVQYSMTGDVHAEVKLPDGNFLDFSVICDGRQEYLHGVTYCTLPASKIDLFKEFVSTFKFIEPKDENISSALEKCDFKKYRGKGDFSGCKDEFQCFMGVDRVCGLLNDCSNAVTVGDNLCHPICNADNDCQTELNCEHREAFTGDVLIKYDICI